jgi:hypothetical protein
MNTHSSHLFEDLPNSAYSANAYNFIPHILYLKNVHSFIPGVPDRRSRSLEVIVVKRINNLGSEEFAMGREWGELRKGRSVYKQPGTRVDGSCHSKEGSK